RARLRAELEAERRRYGVVVAGRPAVDEKGALAVLAPDPHAGLEHRGKDQHGCRLGEQLARAADPVGEFPERRVDIGVDAGARIGLAVRRRSGHGNRRKRQRYRLAAADGAHDVPRFEWLSAELCRTHIHATMAPFTTRVWQ